MNEVGLHDFIGKCGSLEPEVLESIFPMSEKRRITFEQLEHVMVFVESEGYEQTITYWFNYLHKLAKYDAGMVILWQTFKIAVIMHA